MKGTELSRDIALLKQTLLCAHPSILHESNDFNPNFDFITRESFNSVFEDTIWRAEGQEQFTQHEALKLLLPLVTALNDEHVEIPFAKTEEFCQENKLPVTFLIEDGELRIATGTHPSLSEGMVVAAINGVSADVLINKMEHWFSGASREMRLALLSFYFEEALLLYFDHPDELKLDCGEPVTLRFSGIKSAEAVEYGLKNGVAHLKIRSFTGEKQTFKETIERMFADIAQKGATRLSIDIRNNQGGVTAYGDLILSRIAKMPYTQLLDSEIHISQLSREGFEAFLPNWLVKSGLHKYIPVYGRLFRAKDGETVKIGFKKKKPKGDFASLDVEVLVNKVSMSTASLFAAAVLHYRIGHVCGETGGFPSHFGNQFNLNLPASHIQVSIPVSKNTGHGYTCVTGDEIERTTVGIIDA